MLVLVIYVHNKDELFSFIYDITRISSHFEVPNNFLIEWV